MNTSEWSHFARNFCTGQIRPFSGKLFEDPPGRQGVVPSNCAQPDLGPECVPYLCTSHCVWLACSDRWLQLPASRFSRARQVIKSGVRGVEKESNPTPRKARFDTKVVGDIRFSFFFSPFLETFLQVSKRGGMSYFSASWKNGLNRKQWTKYFNGIEGVKADLIRGYLCSENGFWDSG